MSTIFLVLKTKNTKIHKWFIIVAVSAIVAYPISHPFLCRISEYTFVILRKDKLDKLAHEIKEYSKIKQMSDGQRFWKSINNISIESKIKDTTSNEFFGPKYFLDDILAKENVEKNKYEDFRQQLISIGFIEFETLEDGSLSFTIDGMLDNCEGYAYSTTGENPVSNNCGVIIFWKKVADNWYVWATT